MAEDRGGQCLTARQKYRRHSLLLQAFRKTNTEFPSLSALLKTSVWPAYQHSFSSHCSRPHHHHTVCPTHKLSPQQSNSAANISRSYSGSAPFKPRQGHRIYTHNFRDFSQSAEIVILNRPRPLPFHIPLNLIFTIRLYSSFNCWQRR